MSRSGARPRARGRSGVALGGVLACALGVGCADAPGPSGLTVRDSAGVTVVEHEEGLVAPWWALAREPDWVVTEVTVASGEAHPLHGVVAVGVLGPERVVVAERSGDILVGAPAAGTWERWADRGQGPGQLQALGSVVARPPDTVVAFDLGTMRAVTLSAGSVVAEASLASLRIPTYYPVWAPVGDDHWVFLRSTWPTEPTDGSYRGSGPLVRVHGAGVDTLATLPGNEGFFVASVGAGPTAFGARTHMAGTDAGVWIASSDRPELTFWTREGLSRVTRWRAAAQPVTEELVAAVHARMLEGLPEADRPRAEQFLDAVPIASELPLFSDIVAAESGGVWIAQYQPAELRAQGEPAPTGVWQALDAEGRSIGRIRLPAGFAPHVIGEDYVIGVHTDPLGIASVRRYALDRGGA